MAEVEKIRLCSLAVGEAEQPRPLFRKIVLHSTDTYSPQIVIRIGLLLIGILASLIAHAHRVQVCGNGV